MTTRNKSRIADFSFLPQPLWFIRAVHINDGALFHRNRKSLHFPPHLIHQAITPSVVNFTVARDVFVVYKSLSYDSALYAP